MTSAPDLDGAVLRAALRLSQGVPERDVAVHAAIDSTSDELKRRLAAGVAGPGSLVIASAQSRGRGRQGRSWFSPEGGQLYASLAVAVGGSPAERVPFVPLAAGVAAIDALSANGCRGIVLKWPNDLLRAGRKVGGVLCEAVALRTDSAVVVVGLGVNTGGPRFEGALAGTAACLDDGAGGPRPELVAAAWVAAIEGWAERLSGGDFGALVETWKARAEPFGRRVCAAGIEGTTVGLDARGYLLVRTDAGMIETIGGGVVEDAG